MKKILLSITAILFVISINAQTSITFVSSPANIEISGTRFAEVAAELGTQVGYGSVDAATAKSMLASMFGISESDIVISINGQIMQKALRFSKLKKVLGIGGGKEMTQIYVRTQEAVDAINSKSAIIPLWLSNNNFIAAFYDGSAEPSSQGAKVSDNFDGSGSKKVVSANGDVTKITSGDGKKKTITIMHGLKKTEYVITTKINDEGDKEVKTITTIDKGDGSRPKVTKKTDVFYN